MLVPADPIKAIDMGWAYLDAAREAEPGKDWAFSHAGYRAMIAAAPDPVESACRTDGRCEYAIQSGAEGNGHCPNGKCAMPTSAPGTGSDSLDCILGVGGFASFGPLDAQPAAHLTIPGALEWDGDNGTHGADGESRADGESALLAGAGEHVEEHLSKQIDILAINLNSVRAQLANTEQSRRSFFDLSQDLEKRLAEHKALLLECQPALEKAGYSTWQFDELLSASANPESFPCWSCHAPVTMANRADADGNCQHCEAELDLEDWPRAKGGKGGEQ